MVPKIEMDRKIRIETVVRYSHVHVCYPVHLALLSSNRQQASSLHSTSHFICHIFIITTPRVQWGSVIKRRPHAHKNPSPHVSVWGLLHIFAGWYNPLRNESADVLQIVENVRCNFPNRRAAALSAAFSAHFHFRRSTPPLGQLLQHAQFASRVLCGTDQSGVFWQANFSPALNINKYYNELLLINFKLEDKRK